MQCGRSNSTFIENWAHPYDTHSNDTFKLTDNYVDA